MTVPYFPSMSWAERTARRVPQQYDALGMTLGGRFGMGLQPQQGGGPQRDPNWRDRAGPVERGRPPASPDTGSPWSQIGSIPPQQGGGPQRDPDWRNRGGPVERGRPPVSPDTGSPWSQIGSIPPQQGGGPQRATPPASTYQNPFVPAAVPRANTVAGNPDISTGPRTPPPTTQPVQTNPDGTRSVGGYTVDASGNLVASPNRVDLGHGNERYDWGQQTSMGSHQEEHITPEAYAAMSALGLGANFGYRAGEDGQGYYVSAMGADGRELDPWLREQADIAAANIPAAAAPTGPQQYSSFGLDPELDALVREGLISPSRYDEPLVSGMWRNRAADLDSQFDQASRGLDANLRSRGIADSTFGGTEHLALAGVRRDAKSQALQALMEEIAGTMSSDRSRAISDALSLRGSREGSRQSDRTFDLAERFGLDDRRYRDRAFDFDSSMGRERFNHDIQRWLDEMAMRYNHV